MCAQCVCVCEYIQFVCLCACKCVYVYVSNKDFQFLSIPKYLLTPNMFNMRKYQYMLSTQ